MVRLDLGILSKCTEGTNNDLGGTNARFLCEELIHKIIAEDQNSNLSLRIVDVATIEEGVAALAEQPVFETHADRQI